MGLIWPVGYHLLTLGLEVSIRIPSDAILILKVKYMKKKGVSKFFCSTVAKSSITRIHYAREGMLLKSNDLGSMSVLGFIFPVNINDMAQSTGKLKT